MTNMSVFTTLVYHSSPIKINNMNKIIIAVCLLSLGACTKSTTSNSTAATNNDTTFNGSYLKVSVNGKNFYEKDAQVGSNHVVMVTSTSSSFMLEDGSTTTRIIITNLDPYGVYGLGATPQSTTLYCYGNGTGTFPMYVRGGVPSTVFQANPAIAYQDSTGTMVVTHNGSDYLEGTFTANLYYSGFTYPATGSFKIVH